MICVHVEVERNISSAVVRNKKDKNIFIYNNNFEGSGMLHTASFIDIFREI